MNIRPMLIDDLDSVVLIENVSFPSPWSKVLFEVELKRSPARYFTAEEEGRVLGYMGYWEAPQEAHIITLAVAPEARGKGVAKALAGYCMEYAAKQGARLATLEVRDGNGAGKALYESLGFRPVAIRRKYYQDNQEDAVVMIRELPPPGPGAPGSGAP
jgi:ribosomal-protein-alanine N-acetyltransferase